MSEVQPLPIITAQSDFLVTIEEVKEGLIEEGSFWVSCYRDGHPTVHEDVKVSINETDRDEILLKPKNASITIDRLQVSNAIL